MVHDSPFSATNHRGVLIPKTSDINLTYAKYVLEPIFRELKRDVRVKMVKTSTHRYHHL